MCRGLRGMIGDCGLGIRVLFLSVYIFCCEKGYILDKYEDDCLLAVLEKVFDVRC